MFRLLFSFHGRIGRVALLAGLVMFQVICWVVLFPVVFILLPAAGVDVLAAPAEGDPLWLVVTESVAITLSIWSHWALAVKRCHDLGVSWRLSFVLFLAAFLCANLLPSGEWVAQLVLGAAFLGMAAVPGDLAANRFGECPDRILSIGLPEGNTAAENWEAKVEPLSAVLYGSRNRTAAPWAGPQQHRFGRR